MENGRQGTERTLVEALEAAVGAASVAADTETLDRYARNASGWTTRPAAVVFPRSTPEVQAVVRAAGPLGAKLYAVSGGRNWGYGDAAAPTPGQVVVDLSRMNRIVEVDVRLAYAVVEAGVTQGQLYDHLREHDLPLWLDATGAGRDATLVGNTADRGFGHTRYGDHFLAACGMKVVLGDGSVLDTGLTGVPDARAARAYRYGVGPFLDGLFVQSNLGIITEVGVWLMPKPRAFRAFFVSSPHEDALAGIVDRLGELRMRGVLQSTVHIANDLRVIASRDRYPWDRTGGVTPLPDRVRAELRREYGIGAWNVAGALYGPPGVVQASARALRRELRDMPGVRLRVVGDRELAVAEATLRWLTRLGRGERLGKLLEALRPVYGLLQGVPSDDALRSTAWRVRGALPAGTLDPRELHAGLRWVSPVVPARGDAATEVAALMERVYAAHGFEALITFTLINERALIAVSNVAFDTREREESERASACYEALVDELLSRGYPPYRLGPWGNARMVRENPDFWRTVAGLKAALDPMGLLSPGRYLPEQDPMSQEKPRP